MSSERDAIETILSSTLPERSRWMLDGTPLDFNFAVKTRGLQRLSGDVLRFDQDGTWAKLLMFGEYHYAEGGGARPFLCIREDGSVCGLDVERDASIFPLNSSVEKFVTSFRLLESYLADSRPLPADCVVRLRTIDPETPNSDWLVLAAEFSSSPP